MAKINTYIQQQIDRYSDEWIVALRPEDIQRATKRIVKDMVRGLINYELHGKFFLDSKFLENLIIGVSNELESNSLNYNACNFYYQYYPNTPNIQPHIYRLGRLCYIYNTILERLNYVKMSGNVGYLTDISALLYNDRNNLN